jgi:short subunit dehydrogenase-like uncharacterized protein
MGDDVTGDDLAHRDLDLVLMGATGYVGRLTAAQLVDRAPAGTRVALAGRNLPKLEAVRAGLDDRAASWPLIQVDSSDAQGLAVLADSTTTVVSTVGPYLRHGMPLVAACARAGTS